MKHLLVASDLSRRSELAVAQALFLARRFDASLTVLHVTDDELPAAVFEAAREQAKASLRGTVERLAGTDAVRVAVRVAGGLDFQVIVDAAEQEDASLIVLGAHRRNLLKDVFTGTTVERVVRNTTRPVLVAKRPDPGGYPCTVAAVDLTFEAVDTARVAHLMAAGQTVYLMHVLDDAVQARMRVADASGEHLERYRDSMEERCRGVLNGIAERALLGAADFLPIVQWGAAAHRIAGTAQTLHAGLCVIGTRTHTKTSAQRLFLGSVCEEVLRDMACDVLALPLPGDTGLPGADALTTIG